MSLLCCDISCVFRRICNVVLAVFRIVSNRISGRYPTNIHFSAHDYRRPFPFFVLDIVAFLWYCVRCQRRWAHEYHRRTILRQYNPIGAKLPQDRRICTHLVARYPERGKALRNADRGAKRSLREVQGQHIGTELHDRCHGIHPRLQARPAADGRSIRYWQR